jgi:uncharacterized protein YecE (DUF72 family)
MEILRIGTAGWSVPKTSAAFPAQGSMLERYAAVFSAVEINSSFYRRHRPDTWQRWHDSVPEHFAFSVKMPRTITHDAALAAPQADLDTFISDLVPLGRKLGAVLIQLPPKLHFELPVADAFVAALRERAAVPAFIEPRHESWATAEASDLLDRYAISRVLADPQLASLRREASVAPQYLRLHGSPRIYYSAYADSDLDDYANLLRGAQTPAWCIFDNTASGAAIDDALRLQAILEQTGA